MAKATIKIIPKVKNFGDSAMWAKPPDMVVECIKQNHQRSDLPRFSLFYGEITHSNYREVRCDVCGYVYYYKMWQRKTK